MRQHVILGVAAGALLTSVLLSATPRAQGAPPAAQPPAAQPPAAQPPAGAPAGQAGGRGRGGGQSFPNTQRKPADPVVVERGNTLYGINCRLCHGPDLRGGDMGGVNLLRSALVLSDQDGELIYPVIRNGRNPEGRPPMPPLPLSEEDGKAIAAYIHSVAARMAGQGGPPPRDTPLELNILVGDAAAGQRFVQANCATCHSTTGDLATVGSRYPSPMSLQNAWVSGGGGRGGRGRGAAPEPAAAPGARVPRVTTAAVTTADGQRFEGPHVRIDDFLVTIMIDGMPKTFRRTSATTPAVQVTDPLAGHKQLWLKMTDKDMHDVTAYLVTLK
jgi:cytochrome c oxidase cbb3-type subunit 3